MNYHRIFEDWRWNRHTFPQKHILVCEDDLGSQAAIVDRLGKLFGNQGRVQVTLVPGAEMGAAILRACPVDLMILDHDMPWGCGSSLLAWMGSQKILVPIMTASGLPENNDCMATMARAMGMQTFERQKGEIIDGRADLDLRLALGM